MVLSGAVTSEDTRASEIGTQIISAGGNAVDAVIATIIAINTLCPYHSDLGGGGFAILRTIQGEYKSLNFRHTAPGKADSEFYKDPNISTSIGGSSVAVPGEIKGLEELHKNYGKLPWENLFKPSIELAENGFEVKQDLHNFITAACNPPGSTNLKGSWMENDPSFSSLFIDNQAIPLGYLWRRPEYAKTLKKLAKEGSEVFYNGEIAQAIVKIVNEKGGLMTLDDLKNYTVEWNEPISIDLEDYTIWSVPAPASGAIFLSALGMLDQFEHKGEGSIEDLHILTEALRLAYGQRTLLGDPNFVPGLKEIQLSWLQPESIKERSKLITDQTHPPDYYKPPKVEIVNDNGTSNITVADSNGMVISITTTVGLGWGSRIMVPNFGFILNDSMDDFSIKGRPNGTGYEPQIANYVIGGKRPLSSSCPYIINYKKNKKPFASGGSAGSSTIISTNIQIVRNLLKYKLNNFNAIDYLKLNRLHNQILPNYTILEKSSIHQNILIKGFIKEQEIELKKKGHNIKWIEKNQSLPVLIKFDYDSNSNSNSNSKEEQVKWQVAAEPRRNDTGGSIFIAPKED
ncbi:gamma-glutamyltransferase [Kwoniella pini CBS 10737]|uniref:Glutathione hydrolase n=1 Tax=Kwoniella pini CBS 10737 TaxID=1296096 RepID=A0A1B9IE68_9TREE|nr:gamma-glutamyltransferase [Kwoniella pini CBS 10737]OCF53875.1 gamma-glutamyltransferase [Kwoniella pini CBS 10737]